MIVLHDDLDRVIGKYSIKNGGSPEGHNGLKSII
jgi:peptidyl-tRNA hydrolase, PTH1 family